MDGGGEIVAGVLVLLKGVCGWCLILLSLPLAAAAAAAPLLLVKSPLRSPPALSLPLPPSLCPLTAGRYLAMFLSSRNEWLSSRIAKVSTNSRSTSFGVASSLAMSARVTMIAPNRPACGSRLSWTVVEGRGGVLCVWVGRCRSKGERGGERGEKRARR